MPISASYQREREITRHSASRIFRHSVTHCGCAARYAPRRRQIGRADVVLPALDVLEQRRAVGKARSPRELVELVTRLGQAMDRLIVHDAQAVLDAAQEPIALIEQLDDAGRRDPAAPLRRAARPRSPVVRSAGCAWPCTSCRNCAANSTSIDAAGADLEIAGPGSAAAELALDAVAHRARSPRRPARRDRGRRAVDGLGRERGDLGAERAIAGDRPQLDQRLALPQPRVLARDSAATPRARSRAGPASRTAAAACRPRRAGRAACAGEARRAGAARAARLLDVRAARRRRLAVVVGRRTRRRGRRRSRARGRRACRARAPRAAPPGGGRARGQLGLDDRERAIEARLGDRRQLDAHRERIERAREVGEPDAQHVAVLDLGDRAPHRFGIARVDRREPRGEIAPRPARPCASARSGRARRAGRSARRIDERAREVRARAEQRAEQAHDRGLLVEQAPDRPRLAAPRDQIAERAQRLIRIGRCRDLGEQRRADPRRRARSRRATAASRDAGARARARRVPR